MIRFNTQTAEYAGNQVLCKELTERLQLGQSVRHIANTFGISDYAVKKLAKFWLDSKRLVK